MTYIYPGNSDYISRYVTGHLSSSETSGDHRTLCGLWFGVDSDLEWTTRERAEPGTRICNKCKQKRQERDRKRSAPKVVTIEPEATPTVADLWRQEANAKGEEG